MYMIELSESKVENLAEHLEKGIRYIGKAMQCIDELKSEHNLGERMGNRMGNRDPREWEEEDYGERMGQRMGQRGRYSRY